MAQAGVGRFKVGERLWLVDVDGVLEVVVAKTTGRPPHPQLVTVRKPDGNAMIMHPMSLSRDRAAMIGIHQAFAALVAAARTKGAGSDVWLAARRHLIEVELEVASRHPYQLSPGEHPDLALAIRPPFPPLARPKP